MSNQNGNQFIYDWKTIFSGKERTLIRGEDYECASHGMAQQVRNMARRMGVKVSLRIHENSLILTIVKGKRRGKSAGRKSRG